MDFLLKIGLGGAWGAFSLLLTVGLALLAFKPKAAKIAGKVLVIASVLPLLPALMLTGKLLIEPLPAPVAVVPQTASAHPSAAVPSSPSQTIGLRVQHSDGVSFERGKANGYDVGGDINDSKNINLKDAELNAPANKEAAKAPGAPAPTSQVSAPPVVIPPGTPPDIAAAMQDMADRKARGEPMSPLYFKNSSNMTFVNMTMSGFPYPIDVRDSQNINFPGAVLNRNTPGVASPGVPAVETKAP